MEHRRLQNERRVRIEKRDGGTATMNGYAAVFYDGTPGTQYALWPGMVERVMPTAFDRAINEDDVRALFNHDVNQVFGRNKAGTMRLSVDNVGLAYEIDLPSTAAANDLQVLIERGDVTGSSFSFEVMAEAWTKERTSDGVEIEVRQLQDVRLFDVGPVTFPAYEATSVGVRVADDVDEAKAAAEKFREAEKLKQELLERELVARDLRLDAIREDANQ